MLQESQENGAYFPSLGCPYQLAFAGFQSISNLSVKQLEIVELQ